MRKLFLLASLLICLTSVNGLAQEAPPAQKAATETEQPKNAVDRAVDEAKEHGEKVLGTCLMDCEGTAPVTEGVESGHAIELPAPAYPPIARAAHAQGTVEVKVLVDFDGSVIAAVAISGHPLLQAASVNAARQARFTPMKYNGEPVKIVGVIQYHFVAE
jgi:TonB family protein